MKISEAISTGILLFGGLLFLKAIGGIKGLTDIFGGIGGLFGGGVPPTPRQTPQDILTGTQELAAQFEAMLPEEQKAALGYQTIEMTKTALETDPRVGYIGKMEEAITSPIAPFPLSLLGPVIEMTGGVTGQMAGMVETGEQEVTRRLFEAKAIRQEETAVSETWVGTGYEPLIAIAETRPELPPVQKDTSLARIIAGWE